MTRRLWSYVIYLLKGANARFVNLEHMHGALLDDVKALRARVTELQRDTFKTKTDVLYATIGRALTAWALMEEMLVILAATLLRIKSEKAGLMMYSINFSGWLPLIHDLFDTDAELKHFQKRFGKLTERIKKIRDTRDRLAHHAVSTSIGELAASDMDIRSKSKKQPPLSPKNVSDFTDTVLDITSDIAALVRVMREVVALPSPETSFERATDPSLRSDFQQHQPRTEPEGPPPPSQE